MSDIVERLRGDADVFELAHAPHHLVLHMRAAADEIERLRAGGCARDQRTTQYCVEAAHKAAYIARMDTKLERWRMALMKIAQGNGDPVALACKALEADNG